MKWKEKPDPLDRIMRKRTEQGTCWMFGGARTRAGYGVIGVDLRTVYVHRYAYERLIGPIPEGLVIDHLCRNRACFNPQHLEPVTQQENRLRGDKATVNGRNRSRA